MSVDARERRGWSCHIRRALCRVQPTNDLCLSLDVLYLLKILWLLTTKRDNYQSTPKY